MQQEGFLMQMLGLFQVRQLLGMKKYDSLKKGEKFMEEFIRANFPGQKVQTVLDNFQNARPAFEYTFYAGAGRRFRCIRRFGFRGTTGHWLSIRCLPPSSMLVEPHSS